MYILTRLFLIFYCILDSTLYKYGCEQEKHFSRLISKFVIFTRSPVQFNKFNHQHPSSLFAFCCHSISPPPVFLKRNNADTKIIAEGQLTVMFFSSFYVTIPRELMQILNQKQGEIYMSIGKQHCVLKSDLQIS